MGPVYWRGPVFFQRKVWPVGKVRGSESSDWVRLSGVHFEGLLVVRVCGFGGVGGGCGVSLGLFSGEGEFFSDCMINYWVPDSSLFQSSPSRMDMESGGRERWPILFCFFKGSRKILRYFSVVLNFDT